MSTFTTPEDFKAAYDTLNATYGTGVTKSVKWRKWQLKQVYWMLNDNEDEFVRAMNQDLHRHPLETVAYDLAGTKGELLDMLAHVDEWSQGEAPTGAGFVMGRLGKAWLRKEPLGVVLIIGAWNFPLYTLMGPAMSAIAAGNCIMLKPSELASETQNLLVKLIPKYLDQSAIRICTGGPQETGRMLEQKFNHIFYTGGSKVGRIIATAGAKHLTPVTLELGGQAPAIVTKSADLDVSAKRIAHAKLTNAGQICLNVNHVFADPTIHDELVKRVVHWMKEFLQNGTDHLSHIISDNHFSRVTGLLEKTRGNVVYSGANDASTKFVHPAIITDVENSDSLLSEELFAPFLPVIKADLATAVETINSMPHPLGLYIFSNDKKEIKHILDNTTSGGVTINDLMIHAGVPSAPFGGVGESGYGSYRGKYGFDTFSHTRTVVTMPTYLEMVMTWRYAPYKIENRKFMEGQMPKVTFKPGEGMEDQTVGASRGSAIRKLALMTGVLATTIVIDQFSGGRLGVSRRLTDIIAKLRS